VAEQDFSQTFETVDWSQARFINQEGRELDRAVFTRTAGQAHQL
jgi:hypothetical protein